MSTSHWGTNPHTDSQIHTMVVKELDWSTNVRSEHIGVAVTDGAVSLSGEVGSYSEKVAAVKAAWRVKGVQAVADEIDVRHTGGTIHDADIARELQDALGRSSELSDLAIHADVRDHVVELSGTVDWNHQREQASRLAGSIRGVRDVSNRMTLTARTTPAEVHSLISAALVRNAELDADAITVHIEADAAELDGIVRSWAERRQAERAVWSAPGITRVENRLRIG